MLLFSPDELRCGARCVFRTIFGSLCSLSAALSALKLTRWSSTEGRCSRSRYANVCLCVLLSVKINTHTQVRRVGLTAGVERRERPLLLHFVAMLSDPRCFRSCCQLPALHLTAVSKRINMEMSSIRGIERRTLTSHSGSLIYTPRLFLQLSRLTDPHRQVNATQSACVCVLGVLI